VLSRVIVDPVHEVPSAAAGMRGREHPAGQLTQY